MNEEARKIILKHFCDRSNLSHAAMSKGLVDVICASTAPYLLMLECLDNFNSSDATDGLLLKMIDRIYETSAGALALISLGHLREAEILSRSVLESSVTVSFIVNTTPQLRMAQFFLDYVNNEKDQNRKWQNDLATLPQEMRMDHQTRIDEKNKAMKTYKVVIESYLAHCGINTDLVKALPTLIDRFTELGRRIDYRTVYAAMCSQSHHDAEDMLNDFIVNGVEGCGHLASRIKGEADVFSIFLILFGLQWFVEATQNVCSYLKFPTAAEEAKVSWLRLEEELQMIALNIDIGVMPKTWTIQQ